MKRILLASGSPRRSALLAAAGIDFDIFLSDHEEEAPNGNEDPAAFVRRAAEDKLKAALESAAKSGGNEDAVAICADTVVAVDGVIFGKPADAADARRMLAALSGRTHQVHTGVAIGEVSGGRKASFVDTTDVEFLPIAPGEIEAYVATGEPMDKAGAYGIQERASAFVSKVNGNYANVVGLPVSGVVRTLAEKFDIHVEERWKKP